MEGTSGTLELPDGGRFPFPPNLNAAHFKPGDVIDLATGALGHDDDFLDRFRIGIVQTVGEHLVVDSAGQLVDASNLNGVEVSIGATVRIDNRGVIHDVVSTDGIFPEPLRVASGDDFDAARLIQPTSKGAFGWEHFGGFRDVTERARTLVEIHLSKREKIRELGGSPIRGVLFSGPPGTGKTFLAKIIASQVGATLYVVSPSQLGGHLVGESEARLDALYAHAAERPGLSLIFFDELDSITRARGADNGSHASRLVNTFLSNLDGFESRDDVVTIGTTNRFEDIDPALTRHGRFGYHIRFRHPTDDDREQILLAQESDAKRVHKRLPLRDVAIKTAGWTAADLHAIWTYAAGLAAASERSAIASDHFWMAVELVERDRAQRQSLAQMGG